MPRSSRLRAPLLAPGAALLCAACLVDNPNFDGTGATTTADESSSAAAAATSSEATSTTTTTSSYSGGESASGSSTTGETTGPLTSGAASSTGPDNTSTGPDNTSTGPDNTSTGPDDTTEDPPPAKMRIQRYDEDQCTVPLWCIYNMNPNQPATARIFSQECFTDLTPPFKITRIGYWIANVKGVPSSPAIALRGYNGKPSDDAIASRSLAPSDVQPGYHNIDLDWTVNDSAFCIGLTGGGQYSSSLGVAVDMVPPPLKQSFMRNDGPDKCYTYGAFNDIAIDKPVPTGQWCIDVDVEPL